MFPRYYNFGKYVKQSSVWARYLMLYVRDTHLHTHRRVRYGSFHGSGWNVENWGLRDLCLHEVTLGCSLCPHARPVQGWGKRRVRTQLTQDERIQTGPWGPDSSVQSVFMAASAPRVGPG